MKIIDGSISINDVLTNTELKFFDLVYTTVHYFWEGSLRMISSKREQRFGL